MQDTASPKPEHQALLRKYRLPLQLRTTKWELAQWYWNDELRAFCVDALKLGEEDQGVRTALTQCGIKSVAMAQQRIGKMSRSSLITLTYCLLRCRGPAVAPCSTIGVERPAQPELDAQPPHEVKACDDSLLVADWAAALLLDGDGGP